MSWLTLCAAFSCVAEQPQAGHARMCAQLAHSPLRVHCSLLCASPSHGLRAKCPLLAARLWLLSPICTNPSPPLLPVRYEKLVSVMEKYDVDQSGVIDFGEFLRMFRNELLDLNVSYTPGLGWLAVPRRLPGGVRVLRARTGRACANLQGQGMVLVI